ncbi:C25 family cysteine peptidase [Pseudobdellovibrio exovorus]|uniref:Gingipain domain-containing protein n=1 Tax=Pseudobdellovibrio exovorus JSS TaxID=1184267 RepID=M4V9H6_9BACT|nr:C25 family cysteine peptidase [Pseudobdellovibrio exovorus]AGH95095.1 hypothetical protein A11Q_879 [Pseudobdellovibrio exovorus JSS]
MKFNLIGLILLATLSSHAAEKFKVSIHSTDIKIQSSQKENAFTHVSVDGTESEKTVGAPELPVKSWLVQAKPEQIKVQFKSFKTEKLSNIKPYPVQEQDCRCAQDQIKTFKVNNKFYAQPMNSVNIDYLGSYRGIPVSRVDVRLGQYNSETNEVEIVTDGDVTINMPLFTYPQTERNSYLIVSPLELVDGLTAFTEWKRSQGYTVHVETVTSPSNDLNAIQALIKKYYDEHSIDFAIIVGDENTIPMFRVSTSGSYQTPSDLKYFTMDGADDYIPDVLASRIVATSVEQVTAQLAKSIEFEQRAFQDASGLRRFIGIASNEGSNPSDNQYITSIGDRHKEVNGSEVLHYYQNDRENSNPAGLNRGLNTGAAWLTYMGHGSGTSWDNLNQTYYVRHIPEMRNQTVVKPIIIDVACQNGRLLSRYLGTSFMNPTGEAAGAAAYYGGTVNISWHPPAVMAQGIAFQHLEKKFKHLGEALMAGQMYLASRWNNKTQIIDNMEWYHLQGDPGLNIQF